MSSLSYLLINFCICISILLIGRFFFNFRFKKSICLCSSIVFSLFFTIMSYIFEDNILFFYGLVPLIICEELFCLAIMMVFYLCFFEGKRLKKIYLVCFFILINLIFYILYYLLVLLIGDNAYNLFVNNVEYKFIFKLVINFSFGLMVYVIYKVRKNTRKNFKILILPILIYTIVLFPLGMASNDYISTWNMHYLCIIVFSIMGVTILGIVLFEKIVKSNALKVKNLIMLKEQEMYKAQIERANVYIEEIAKIKHDMKNEIFCISEMVSNGNDIQAIQLCNNITDKLNNSTYIFHTSNIYLNSILNVVYKKAKEKNIDIKIVVKTNLEYIDGTDLISILGNLCDNAIEALDFLEHDRNLIVSMFEKGGNYIISVKNYVEESVLKHNKTLRTSKLDKSIHGFGLKNVSNIVKKYDGILDISEEMNLFIVNIMIEIPSATEK